MKKKVENRLKYNIVYGILLFLVVFSSFFTSFMSKILKIKPDIKQSNMSQIHFIDVGQGDAIAIKFSDGKTMLIDSGTEKYRYKLTQYLDKIVLNDNKIDYLVLTHIDEDHSGNMKYILDNYEIGTFFRPPFFESVENGVPYIIDDRYRDIVLALDKKTNVIFNSDEVELIGDTYSVKWLYPNEFDVNDLENTNMYSPVIIFEENNRKVMFTGDIDSGVENRIMSLYDDETLDIDVLKLAHHGSKNSSNYNFLETTSPNIVVASVGENSYGHPSNDVITRLLELDANTGSDTYNNFYTTKKFGNIIISMKDLSVQNIDNIDNYNFLPYHVYVIFACVFLLYYMLLPYYKVWKKNIRFIIQNKQFVKLKEKEKLLYSQGKLKDEEPEKEE